MSPARDVNRPGPHPHPRPKTYKRSVEIPLGLRDQLYNLADEHGRTLAEEIRHGLRVYVELSDRLARARGPAKGGER